MKRKAFVKTFCFLLLCGLLINAVLVAGGCKRDNEKNESATTTTTTATTEEPQVTQPTEAPETSDTEPTTTAGTEQPEPEPEFPEDPYDPYDPWGEPGTFPPDVDDENEYDNVGEMWGSNIIEDFESYNGDNELLRAVYKPITHDTSYNPNPVISLDTDNPHSGQYCAKFDVPTQDPNAAKQWYSGFDVNLEKPVKFTKDDQVSIWVRVAATSGITSYILTVGGPQGTMAHPAGSVFNNTGDWQKIILPRMDFSDEYIALTRVRIIFELKSQPYSVWIDDLTVEPAPYRQTFEATDVDNGTAVPGFEKAPGSDTISIKLDSTNPYAGNHSGRIDYNSGGSAGYSSLIVPFDSPQDWQRDVRYMSLCLRSDGPSQTVIPGFFANGKQFEYQPGEISGFGWNQYVFLLSEFKYLGFEPPTEDDLKNVDAFFISFIGEDGDRSVWIDNIDFLVEAPVGAGTPKPPEDNQPVAIEDFEGYPDGVLPENYAVWSNNPSIGYYPASVELSQDSPHSGEYCGLFRVYNQTGAVNQYTTRIHEMTVTLSESVPFRGGQSVSIWLKKHNWDVAKTGEYIKLRIYTSAGNVDVNLADSNAPLTGDWERRTVLLGDTGGNITGYRFTVRITDATNPDTGVAYPRFYFDDITLEPLAELKSATVLENFEHYVLRDGAAIPAYQPVTGTGYASGASLTLDSTVFRSQYCSGKLGIPAGADNKYAFETELNPPVTFKDVDTLTLWLKTASSRDYRIDVFTTGGDISTGRATAPGGSDWTKVTIPYGTLSGTSVKITKFRITVWGTASAGTLWFDDFVVTKPDNIIEDFEYYDGDTRILRLEYKPIINPQYSVDGYIELDGSVKHSGDYSGKLVCGSAATQLWHGGVSMKLREPVGIDNTQQVSFWIRSTPWQGINDHQYNVRVITTKGVMSLGIKNFPADNNWHQVIIPCEFGEPALITELQLITANYGYGGRAMWFDDFTVESKP
jgi:hypothetical protein